MDYNSIDEDDVEKLRLAALMTFKKKSHLPLNTKSSSSGEFSQCKFANGNSFNTGRNNRGRFPTSNKSYNKRVYSNVGYRRPTHANNNLIAIIPTDGEGESQNIDLASKNPNYLCSKLTNTSDKPTVIHSLNNEVSTKFSRLENESGSDESEDSEADKNEKEESDDGDVLSLGEEDEDLDDLDKLMDIMEAEIAGKNVQPSKKEKKGLKQNKKRKEKNSDLNVKSKLNSKTVDPVAISQTETSKDIQPLINPPEEELESIKTLEEIRNSSLQCNLLNSHVPLKSPSPVCRKRSISPYNKLQKRSPSPRRRSPSLDRYRYSPIRSRPYRRSLSPRRSPRRLSPLREKNLSPRRYSPPKSRYLYRSPSPRRRRRSVSRDISPSRRRLSPLRRRSRSKSRSPKVKSGNRRRSPSPMKKVRSRPVSPNNRRKDNKIMVDDHIKKKDKIKTIEKQVDFRPIDPVLEARKRKFESNKPIEPSSKKIIFKKTNSVQVAIQTESKEVQNEEIKSEIKPKILYATQKVKKSPQSFQAPKNLSVKMNNDLESVSLQRVIKVNAAQEKKTNKKRPRIVFGHEEPNEIQIDEEDKFDQQKTLTLQPETLDVSSASEEELSVEEEEVEEDEESEKEDGQESSGNDEECIDEDNDDDDDVDDDDDDDDDDNDNEVQQTIDSKKECIQRNDSVDLRTELKRRKELKRLNMIQMEVKKKPGSFYPARILQSAIRGVVGPSSTNEGKRKKHSQMPELSIKTEGNSDGRRVIVMNRHKPRNDIRIEHSENQEDFEEIKSFTSSVKRFKSKLKKVPVRLRTSGVNNDNTIQKGLRKVITRNINVTDFNQM